MMDTREIQNMLDTQRPQLSGPFVYKKKIAPKTILCFIQLGQANKIVQYCKTEEYTPDWKKVLSECVDGFRYQ